MLTCEYVNVSECLLTSSLHLYSHQQHLEMHRRNELVSDVNSYIIRRCNCSN